MNSPPESRSGWSALLPVIPWLLPAIAIRLWVQLSGACVLDSDEGIIGIMMLEAMRGEFRVFYHGQDYLGTLPWIVGAPGLLVFGPNPNGLRFIYIIYTVIILLTWRGILKCLGAAGAWPWLAIIVGVGPAFMVEYTLKARGTVEGILVGSLWLWVLLSIMARERSFEDQRRRFLVLGLATGVAWWTTQLSIFFLVPGALLFFSNSKTLDEFCRLARRPSCAFFLLAIVLTGIVFLRASLSYRSSLQDLLWPARNHLLAMWALALLAASIMAWRGWIPRWPVVGLMGLNIGYLPALAHVWSREILYNTTSLQPIYSLRGNIVSFLLIGVMDILGVGSERSDWSLIPSLSAIFAAGVMISAITLLVLGIARSLRSRTTVHPLDLLVLAGCIWSIGFYCISAPASLPLGHYGAFTGYFLLLAVATFLWRLSLLHRWAAVTVTALLIAIHISSIAQMPRHPMVAITGVERNDAGVIKLLHDEGIAIAATSLSASSTGYWEAYRLTFSSGEQIRVHPILHMPRIIRYRDELRAAPRTAIVSITPDVVTMVFDEEGIAYRTTTFGRMTVIHDFDKAEVDRLGLIDYRRWLDE